MNITAVRPLKIFIMYCSSSYNHDDLTGLVPSNNGDEYKMIALPCSGKVDILYLVKAFEKGSDGLVLLTCPKNECQHLEGNLRAFRRTESVNSILEETGMGKDRMAVLALSEDGMSGIAAGIAGFSVKLRNMMPAASELIQSQ